MRKKDGKEGWGWERGMGMGKRDGKEGWGWERGMGMAKWDGKKEAVLTEYSQIFSHPGTKNFVA
jgi:hypothetical protein